MNVLWQLLIVFSAFLIVYFLGCLIRRLKYKNTNTELWGTIFEGMTNNVIPQEPLKEPEVFVERKVKRDGQDLDLDLNPDPDPDPDPDLNHESTGIDEDTFECSNKRELK